MTSPESSNTNGARWIALAVGVLVIAAGIAWLVGARDEQLPRAAEKTRAETTPTAAAESGTSMPDATPEPAGAAQPAAVITDKGRLTVVLADLAEGEVAAVGLDMPDDVRGEGPRPTKIVDVSRQRMLELEAQPISGSGTGVRLEIDPEWLEPGQYMIQVDTAPTTHFPVRRYVLEVR